MNKSINAPHDVVLAIDPYVRGIGFTLLEGPKDLMDWGMTNTKFAVNMLSKRKVWQLMETYDPDVVVIEEIAASRRCKRVRQLLKSIQALCRSKGINCVEFSRGDIQNTFSNFEVTTKFEIARKLTEYFPELESYLPSKRATWETEDPRYSVFDALSLAFAYYYEQAS